MRLATHAEQALLVADSLEIAEGEPAEIVALVADAQRLTRLGHQEETNVQVQVRGFT